MKKGLSRRDFLKVSAAGALSVATMGAQVAMAQEDEKKEAAVKPSVPGVSGVLDRAKLEKKAWNDPNVLLKVRWSGVNFYEFVLPNGKTIVMDPYFDDPNDEHNEYKYTPTDLPGGEWVHGADVVLLTHGHFDHIIGVPEVKRAFHLPVYASETEDAMLADTSLNLSCHLPGKQTSFHADVLVRDGDELELLGYKWKVIATPGHTSGSVSYYIPKEGVLLSGDT